MGAATKTELDLTVCAHCRESLHVHRYEGTGRFPRLCCPKGTGQYEQLYQDDGSIDTEYLDEPRCPACGRYHQDAWELFSDTFEKDDDKTEHTCGSCGADMEIQLHVSYSYTTTLKEKLSAK